MKIKNINNIEKFFETVNKCSGKVELVGENIRLNLKSKIAQMVSLAQIFSGGNPIEELEIIAYNQDDVDLLIHYMMNGD